MKGCCDFPRVSRDKHALHVAAALAWERGISPQHLPAPPQYKALETATKEVSSPPVTSLTPQVFFSRTSLWWTCNMSWGLPGSQHHSSHLGDTCQGQEFVCRRAHTQSHLRAQFHVSMLLLRWITRTGRSAQCSIPHWRQPSGVKKEHSFLTMLTWGRQGYLTSQWPILQGCPAITSWMHLTCLLPLHWKWAAGELVVAGQTQVPALGLRGRVYSYSYVMSSLCFPLQVVDNYPPSCGARILPILTISAVG